MATNVDLTSEEIEQLKGLTRQDNPEAAIHTAIQEYVRYKQRMQLIELSGRIEMQDNWRELENAELAASHDHGAAGTHPD